MLIKPFSVICLVALLSSSALATPITVDLSSETSRPAVNDMARATVFAEATAASPGEVSRKINHLASEASKAAEDYPGIEAQTSGTHTYPVYSKNGKVESWRMRYELTLETPDIAALSDLLTVLQEYMAVSSIALFPSPDARKRAEDEAMLAALESFKLRAKLIADSEGKSYRIKQLNVGVSGRIEPPVRQRVMALSAESMPLEAGETQVNVSVSGQIEVK